MSEAMHTIENGVNTYWTKYTRNELERAWNDYHGQGNHQARMRGDMCVIVPCDRETALHFTALFMRIFAIPSCAHWDDGILSLYCGDAGSGFRTTKLATELMIARYSPAEKFPKDLFANE